MPEACGAAPGGPALRKEPAVLEKLLRIRVPGIPAHFPGRSLLCNHAVMKHRDPVAVGECCFHLVCDEKERESLRGLQRFEKLEQACRRENIECGRRLVENEEPG